MPIYDYRCEKCNLQIDINIPIKDRDDLASVTKNYCPKYLEGVCGVDSPTGIKRTSNIVECELKRVPTCGGFTI